MSVIPTIVWRDAEQRIRILEEARITGINIKAAPKPPKRTIYGPDGRPL